MNARKVSVIIPAYNAAPYLSEAVESVFRQTFSDFEALVIDDGSTDETPRIAERFRPRLAYCRTEHQGRAAARNEGLRRARGEYVAFLDADDVWEPDRLERGVRLLDQRPEIGLVHGEVAAIDGDGNPKARETAALRKTYRMERHFGSGYLWLLSDESAIFSSTVLFRRAAAERVGFYDGAFPVYEDYDWYLRFAFEYPFFLLESPPVAKYRLHGANSFTEFSPDRVAKIYLAILEKQLAALQAHGTDRESRVRKSRVLRKMVEFHWRMREKKEVRAKLWEAARLDPALALDSRSIARFVLSL